MAIKTRSELVAQIAANFPDNTSAAITPAKLREYLNNELDSEPLFVEGIYLTVTLVEWTALVGASGLFPGFRYRVASAYTFDVYGAKDIVVTADSANTVETTGYVIFGDLYVPYTVDSTLSNPGFFLAAFPSMALTGTQALAYISGYNWKFNNGLSMFLTDGSLYFEAQISGGDTTVILFDNVKAIDLGTNYAAGTFGTYDPNTDTFTPYSTLYKFDVTLTDTAAIQAMNSAPIEIVPDDGTLIQLMSCSMEVNADGTTDYDFPDYVSMNSGGGGVYALTASWNLGAGAGLTPQKVQGANAPSLTNMTLISRIDNNTGGLFLSAAGSDATQGDRTIRVYGTYAKFAV